MDNNQVILVDERNQEAGTASKDDVHARGLLHRAFSVFLFDSSGRQLIQRRASNKYHTGGLWSNACCSHPHPGESVDLAVKRRVREELGLECDVNYLFDMKYRSELQGGLIEHEYDQVYAGTFSGPLRPDPSEIAATRLVDFPSVQSELTSQPGAFTPWFRLLAREVERAMREPVEGRWTQTVVEPDGTVATFYFPTVSGTSV
ncbi:MAG: isopentenyl-diphosphate delta-isomerase [Bacteroidetes bacterium CG12_big_fil_rev_8_21_14_0_65_60_17]|nr:MAG: isopentenyl-diphosphate delta-isomerase [Bacteroidetes bacterium CG12_big_fil_rev_8_21_14_0_65_60_17]